MSIDLAVANDIGTSLQQVGDQKGNQSALLISTQSAKVIGVPPPLGCHLQFGNPQANTQPGQPSSSMTFSGWGIQHAGFVWVPVSRTSGSLKLAFGQNDDPNQNTTQFIVNADGTAAFPGLPGLPGSGTSDLTVDKNGNLAPQTSSVRFKENVELLNDDFQKILALKPKSFTYKDTGFRGIGYMAEDLDELKLNELVGYDADGKALNINYKMMPVYLLEVVKEQQRMLRELQTEVTELKSLRK